jgi:UMP-CMP kinase
VTTSGLCCFGFAAAGMITYAENAPAAETANAVNLAGKDTKAGKSVVNGSSIPGTSKGYLVAFVLGGPGSGKGTQSGKLVEEFDVVHLSAGDLLRAHMKSGSPEGKMVADMIAHGQIVPSYVTVGLLQRAMDESGKIKFLIDGFPRNEENRAAFEAQTGIDPKFVLFFDCPEEVMESRLLARNEGRTDDNIETIRKRFRVFLEQSMPVVNFYDKTGRVARINADRPPEEVYKEVRRAFLEFMV